VAWALAAAGAPARGETFFPEIQVLNARSYVSLTLSARSDDATTDSTDGSVTPATSQQEVDSQRLQVNLRLGPLGLGGLAGGQQLRKATDSFRLKDEQTHGAAYLALGLTGLIDDDRLVLLVSQGTSTERYSFEDFGFGLYERRETLENRLRAGLLYRISVFLVGYAQGQIRDTLSIDDPGRAPIRETFDFPSSVRIAGLIFESRNTLLRLILERLETPGQQGTAVDREPGFADHVEATVGLGFLELSANRTRFERTFRPEEYRHLTETEYALGLGLGDNFRVSASQTDTQQEVGFTLLGIPFVSTTRSTSNLVTFTWQF
jgi:hypothetical protein